MRSCFGEFVRLSLFGESHGEAVGVVIDGLGPESGQPASG
jgi:chorismate synthase